MRREAALFARQPEVRRKIANRLGWVDVASSMKSRMRSIETLGDNVFKDGIRHVVLMGMGGSSLCPELFKLVFGKHRCLKSFDVIDSTDPNAIQAVRKKLQLSRSLFLVASKSGGTVETRSHEAYFMGELRKEGVTNVGSHFTAITDQGSDLQRFARRHKYRKVFVNPPDIGGRYSALSYFGLVPAFFTGVDLGALLENAILMESLLRDRQGESNPAVVLGSLLTAGVREGRDKLTFLTTPGVAPLIPWIEQLVAESTGKKGTGVIPIENEPAGRLEKYGKDRLFVSVGQAGRYSQDASRLLNDLKNHNLPLAELTLGDKHELGGQFILWEAATALAGSQLKVNPFDEPNVTESKENTKTLLAGLQKTGRMPLSEPLARWGNLSLLATGGPLTITGKDSRKLDGLLTQFYKKAKPPRYVSFLNYYKSTRQSEVLLNRIRTLIRDKRGVATLRGYGPRFLHSIGQLYKGGPESGMFVIFVRSDYGRMAIPGAPFDFAQLIRAQANGDASALIERGLPTLVFEFEGSPVKALESFLRATRSALR
jgi:glucose-6-phosphate isomerase